MRIPFLATTEQSSPCQSQKIFHKTYDAAVLWTLIDIQYSICFTVQESDNNRQINYMSYLVLVSTSRLVKHIGLSQKYSSSFFKRITNILLCDTTKKKDSEKLAKWTPWFIGQAIFIVIPQTAYCCHISCFVKSLIRFAVRIFHLCICIASLYPSVLYYEKAH